MPGPLPAPAAPALALPPRQGVEAALLVHGGAGGGRLDSTALALPPVAALTPPRLEYTRIPGARQGSRQSWSLLASSSFFSVLILMLLLLLPLCS